MGIRYKRFPSLWGDYINPVAYFSHARTVPPVESRMHNAHAPLAAQTLPTQSLQYRGLITSVIYPYPYKGTIGLNTIAKEDDSPMSRGWGDRSYLEGRGFPLLVDIHGMGPILNKEGALITIERKDTHGLWNFLREMAEEGLETVGSFFTILLSTGEIRYRKRIIFSIRWRFVLVLYTDFIRS